MKRRLPIGVQDFERLREDGFCYVDKTERVYQLINGSGSAFFLSRPRRFGKSLLCSTLSAVFEGKKELFCGLAIEKSGWEWKKHPVIKLDLNPGDYSQGVSTLDEILKNTLGNVAMALDLDIRGQTAPTQFGNLIQDAYKKHGERTVVIIDEYDKPLLNTIDMPQLHIEMRSALKGFYGILKSSDANLKFVFLTGVTKFSHVSIFSDLNHLIDLTLDPRYADICGITQEELERDFEPEIQGILKERGKERAAYMGELKKFYNGYRFSEKPLKIYNPFGLLNHFDKSGKFLPYWYETGTPTFLINIILKQKVNIPGLNSMKVKYENFSKYDIENMDAMPLLYQAGYLTIVDYEEAAGQFTLDYPNEEVRSSFARSLAKQYLQITATQADFCR